MKKSLVKKMITTLTVVAMIGTMIMGCGKKTSESSSVSEAEEGSEVATVEIETSAETTSEEMETERAGYEGSLAGVSLAIGTDVSFVPFCFPDDNNEYTGFDIEFIDAISEYLGFEYTLEPMDFTALLMSVQTKKLDLGIAGITMTDEREEAMDFATPYYDAGLQIFVKEDSDIEDFGDLEGKTLALKEGTAALSYIEENYPDCKITTFPTIDEAYLEVQRGAADATVFDAPNMLYFVNQNPDCGCKVVGTLADACQYGIIFQDGSEYTEYFNAAIEALRENGTYDAIYEKWFGTGN